MKFICIATYVDFHQNMGMSTIQGFGLERFPYTYRADEILKDWRDETRDLQRQQDKKVRVKGKLVYQKTDESAPFATDSQSNHMDGSPTSTRLKVHIFERGKVLMCG